MKIDLSFTRKLTHTYIEANTDAGVEFLDSWNDRDLQAIDSGHIAIPNANVAVIELAAMSVPLTIEYEQEA